MIVRMCGLAAASDTYCVMGTQYNSDRGDPIFNTYPAIGLDGCGSGRQLEQLGGSFWRRSIRQIPGNDSFLEILQSHKFGIFLDKRFPRFGMLRMNDHSPGSLTLWLRYQRFLTNLKKFSILQLWNIMDFCLLFKIQNNLRDYCSIYALAQWFLKQITKFQKLFHRIV